MYSKLYFGYSALCKEIGEKGATKTRASSPGTLQFNSWMQNVPLSLQIGEPLWCCGQQLRRTGRGERQQFKDTALYGQLETRCGHPDPPRGGHSTGVQAEGPVSHRTRKCEFLIFFKVVSDNVSLKSFFFAIWKDFHWHFIDAIWFWMTNNHTFFHAISPKALRTRPKANFTHCTWPW